MLGDVDFLLTKCCFSEFVLSCRNSTSSWQHVYFAVFFVEYGKTSILTKKNQISARQKHAKTTTCCQKTQIAARHKIQKKKRTNCCNLFMDIFFVHWFLGCKLPVHHKPMSSLMRIISPPLNRPLSSMVLTRCGKAAQSRRATSRTSSCVTHGGFCFCPLSLFTRSYGQPEETRTIKMRSKFNTLQI